jgi:hypothetical protein
LEKLRAASGLRIGAQAVGHPIFVAGRMFAYLLGLKEPKMVFGYGGLELDVALGNGELDARANGADSIFQRGRDGQLLSLLHFHSSITIPKGKFAEGLPKAPELESFAKNDKERQLIELFRAFIYPRWPYILPPATPKETVAILRGAMAKALRDPEFYAEFKKLMTTNATPLTGEEMEVAIRNLPRNPETISLYKLMADQGPLPPR